MHSIRHVIMKAVPLWASRKEHSHVFLASFLPANPQPCASRGQALDHWATSSVAVIVSDSSLKLLCQSFLFTGLITIAPRNAWSASHKAIQIIPDHYAIPSDIISPCNRPDAISSHLQATARVVLAAIMCQHWLYPNEEMIKRTGLGRVNRVAAADTSDCS